MYQALYRKYRPKLLSDVVGQPVPVKVLSNSVKRDNLSHAYLFSGPRGSGKTSVAKILANLVNCKELKGLDVCGQCVFCTQNNEQKMDVIEIDAASNNGVDEIREINNKVKFSPNIGRFKIYIIDEVHMLTIGAFNALLKTLEEPPGHVIFILATTDPQKIPTTIISRCQKLDFKRVDFKSMSERLHYIMEMESITAETGVIEEICRLSDGGMRDAISMLDQLTLYSEDGLKISELYEMCGIISSEELDNIIKLLVNKDIALILKQIEEYDNKGKNIIKITEQIINEFKLILLEEKENDNFDFIVKVIENLNISLSEMRKFNNPKLIMELGIIKSLNFLGNKNIDVKNKDNENLNNISNPNIINNKNVNNADKCSVVEEKELSSKGQENISREIIKTEKNALGNKTIQNNNQDSFNKIKEIRVNNTLSTFSRKNTLEFQKIYEKVEEYLYEPQFKKIINYMIDSKIKAVGENNIIFMVDLKSVSEQFNSNLLLVESLIEKIFKNKFKVISVDEAEWETIKIEFNKKQKKYEYISEKETSELFKEIYEVKGEQMENLFNDLVEYK